MPLSATGRGNQGGEMQIKVTEDTVSLILAALTDRAAAVERGAKDDQHKYQKEHETVVRLLDRIDEQEAQLRELQKANWKKPEAK